MSTTTLHYIYDPLCGWCYGASPLIEITRTLPITIALHAGGMMAGTRRQAISAGLRSFVLEHDARIAAASGQPFGEAYKNDLLMDTRAVFDSEPPITAILAVQSLTPAEQQTAAALDMLKRLQHAHYVEGQRIADLDVLATLAQELDYDAAAFRTAYQNQAGEFTQTHMREARDWLSRSGGNGYPTLVLCAANRMMRLDIGRFLGHPGDWLAYVRQAVTDLEG